MNRYTMLYVMLLGLALLTLVAPATARLLLARQKQLKEEGSCLPVWIQKIITEWAESSLWESIQLAGLILGLTLCLMVVRPCIVVGSSMDGTLYDGQLLCTVNAENVDRVALKRGDIVCLQLQEEQNMLVKRVIGMPGDCICLTQGKVYINGQLIHENYICEPMAESEVSYACQLGEDLYFVMGDNRNVSRDSRSFGLVSRDEILSVAKFGVGRWGIEVFRQPEALAQIHSLATINTMKGE